MEAKENKKVVIELQNVKRSFIVGDRKNMAVPAVCIVISENGNHSDFSVNSGRKDLLNMMKWKELHGHGKVSTEQ